MTPLERLLLEAIPVRPDRPESAPKPAREPWTPEEQAQHRADLDEALDGWTYDEPRRRHLRLVDTNHTERPAA